jgi:hypothetical protein
MAQILIFIRMTVCLVDNLDLGRKILDTGQGGKSTLARALAVELDLP